MVLSDVKQKYLDKAMSNPHGRFVVVDPETGQIAAHSSQGFRHSFDGGKTWVEAVEAKTMRYQSADGAYYEADQLPEHDDAFITELYSKVVRAERNARIDDTDDYIRLPDVTVEKTEGVAREPLSEEERTQVLEYRAALRDMPEQADFPFMEWPAIPEAIRVECERRIEARTNQIEAF